MSGYGVTGEFDQRLAALSTPHLADACLKLGMEVRCGPAALRPIAPRLHLRGPVLPARHDGSAGVFLDAIGSAQEGDVLVVDNGGRTDEACIGDLIALEAFNAGLAGIVIWGLHRDTSELLEIGLPIFSLGALPKRPNRFGTRSPELRDWARIGEWMVTPDDIVSADSDGVIFIPGNRLDQIIEAAEEIRSSERRKVDNMLRGRNQKNRTNVIL